MSTTPTPDGITVRLATAQDVDALFEFARRNATAHAPFNPDPPKGETAAQVRERLLQLVTARGRFPFLVELDGELIGRVTVDNVTLGPWRNATLGYGIDAAWYGRGIATAAVTRVRDLAFAELELHRLEAGTLLDNIASQRVLEKCGFERIGVSRHHLHINGAWRDHVLFSCTPELLGRDA